MNLSSRKARTVSIIAFVLSLLFFIFTLIFGVVTGVLAMYLLSWQILAGLLVWLTLIAQFYQRSLAEQEKLDMSQLAKTVQQETLFSGGADRMALLAVAQKRLKFFERWILPSAAVLIAVYQIIMGLILFYNKVLSPMEWTNRNPLLGAVLMVAVSFICFLFSRYATGMSAEKEWKPLRSGGSYLLTTAILGFALAVSLALSQFKRPQGLVLLNYAIPWLMVVLGAEILLNAIFDIYRPRVAGQYSRAAFDSRLLGMFNEPGGILQTVSHTIDYQFGFKVSQTWFYKLLEKAILPLILFAVLVLYLMSSFVVIGPGYAGVIEYFGTPTRDILPGLHMKYPWPIEKVYIYPTDQIQQISIGYKKGDQDQNKKAFLWGEKHFEMEYNLLVAVETGVQRDKGAVPVSIVQANVPIQYRIKNMRNFLYNHRDAAALLEAICYRELTRFAASAKIEMDEGSGAALQKSLLGAGRMEASHELHNRIQKAADEAELGVEIVLLGLQGVHPPVQVAKEYEAVVASLQQKQATVLDAQAERNRLLAELAGSIDEVNALYDIAMDYERAREEGDVQRIEQLQTSLRTALSGVEGKVFSTLREAESYAFERANLAKGDGLRFGGQIKSYQASPEIYRRIQRLAMLEESLEKIRKYVVVAEKEDSQVFIVDLQESLNQSLYEMGLGLDEK
jgi:regulator of protease activity HflC (stomatin/prohibitin superfamily)